MNINDNNYELWLLRYAEQELTSEERAEMERWLADHPDAAGELALYNEAPRLERDETVHYTGTPLQHSLPLWSTVLQWTAAAAVVAVLMMPAWQKVTAPHVEPIMVAENHIDIPSTPSQTSSPSQASPTRIASTARKTSPAITPEEPIFAENTTIDSVAPAPQYDTLPTDSPIYVDDLIVFEDETPESTSATDILADADITYTQSTSNINPIGHFISTFIKANK